jgi:hypothetical protein
MIWYLVFILINIGLAAFDANRISKHLRIYHGINGLVYLALLGGVYLVTYSWTLILGLTLVRIPVFNTSLNYFRGLKLTYISESTTSIIDQATNFIPKKIGYWPYHIILTLLALILSLL